MTQLALFDPEQSTETAETLKSPAPNARTLALSPMRYLEVPRGRVEDVEPSPAYL